MLWRYIFFSYTIFLYTLSSYIQLYCFLSILSNLNAFMNSIFFVDTYRLMYIFFPDVLSRIFFSCVFFENFWKLSCDLYFLSLFSCFLSDGRRCIGIWIPMFCFSIALIGLYSIGLNQLHGRILFGQIYNRPRVISLISFLVMLWMLKCLVWMCMIQLLKMNSIHFQRRDSLEKKNDSDLRLTVRLLIRKNLLMTLPNPNFSILSNNMNSLNNWLIINNE